MLRFYFSRENFKAANAGAMDLVRSVKQRLVSSSVSEVMPRSPTKALQSMAGEQLGMVKAKAVFDKFNKPLPCGQSISRPPVLDANDVGSGFQHRGLWSEMQNAPLLALAGGTRVNPSQPIQPLLGKPNPPRAAVTFGKVITSLFAFVGPRQSFANAKTAMEALPGCQDVFAMGGGSLADQVVGWVSNIDHASRSRNRAKWGSELMVVA